MHLVQYECKSFSQLVKHMQRRTGPEEVLVMVLVRAETGKISSTRGHGCCSVENRCKYPTGGRSCRRNVVVREYTHVNADEVIIPPVKLFHDLIYLTV